MAEFVCLCFLSRLWVFWCWILDDLPIGFRTNILVDFEDSLLIQGQDPVQ